MSQIDWLSQLLRMISITGQLDIRCAYSGPWHVARAQCTELEIPYHIVLQGQAVFEDSQTGIARKLVGGDILLLPHGSAHTLHDSGEYGAGRIYDHQSCAGWTLSGNDRQGKGPDLLCGRFFIGPPHDRLIRNYLPTTLVVRAMDSLSEEATGSALNHLANLVALMRKESAGDKPGACAVLNAFSCALFTLVLRAVSESGQAPAGLLALAGYSRLAPAISAMFADPARPWKLIDLASLCSMSRASFMRHFQDKLGHSASELLSDIRMSLAANELKQPTMTTEVVAESVGYRSVAAFRRAFADRIGITAGQWRRLMREGE